MPSIDFQNGFLCGLAAMGIPIDSGQGGGTEPGALPDISQFNVVNCEYYSGDFEHCVNYLRLNTYRTILSSNAYYLPSSGIVLIGGWDLADWDSWGDDPRAMLKITVDGAVIYEGLAQNYFDPQNNGSLYNNPVKAFNYKTSFNISARRLNLSDEMFMQLHYVYVISPL